jgi:hypothetical protein
LQYLLCSFSLGLGVLPIYVYLDAFGLEYRLFNPLKFFLDEARSSERVLAALFTGGVFFWHFGLDVDHERVMRVAWTVARLLNVY